jgi:DNA-directed RNA polymerase specialized sigma24 family protein
VYDHFRELLGRTGEKPLANALSLDPEWEKQLADTATANLSDDLLLALDGMGRSSLERETLEVVGLRLASGWTTDQVADALDWPKNRVMSRLRDLR